MTSYRYFKGNETSQIDGHTCQPAEPGLWYFEPEDYQGDVLWSEGYPTRVDAIVASEGECR